MANSVIAAVRNGRSSAFLSGRRPGMIDWSCSAVTMLSPPKCERAHDIADESRPRTNRIAGHVNDVVAKVLVNGAHARAERRRGLERHAPIAVRDIDLSPARQCEDRILIPMPGGGLRCG